MLCPFCGHESSKVLESRSTAEKSSIRRRRECENCQKRFTTYEKIEFFPLIIVKKNGSREEYSRSKLFNSINTACNKCDINIDIIEDLIDNIEFEFSLSGKKEISSFYLGEKILEELKNIDMVAYLRYVSVFKQFKNIEDFVIEIKNFDRQLALV
ncbi:MAG: transcriptional regulator NrdR [Candidatus Gastranaerophilales bacterium]|nr:transcriptional regulator NrdR [Candidatus Gastranaerophilales bacterium]